VLRWLQRHRTGLQAAIDMSHDSRIGRGGEAAEQSMTIGGTLAARAFDGGCLQLPIGQRKQLRLLCGGHVLRSRLCGPRRESLPTIGAPTPCHPWPS
jgi:hypothetical protein